MSKTGRGILACALLLGTVFHGWWGHASAAAQETFYYRDGEKVPLKIIPSKNFVLFAEEATPAAIQQGLSTTQSRAGQIKPVEPPQGIDLAPGHEPQQRSWAVVERAPAVDSDGDAAAPVELEPLTQNVLYQAPFVEIPNGKQVGISQWVYVKLKQASDLDRLRQQAASRDVTIVGNNTFLPLWYTLECDKDSSGHALQVANSLYETNAFQVAEPDFLSDYKPQSVDPLYDRQWALHNTGQHGSGTSGIDIGVEAAWQVTSGVPAVVVAVLDQGIDLGHADLLNGSSTSYDTLTGGISQVRGNHGTACAGVIGAARDNGRGIAGIAPQATLMSISDPLLVSPGASQKLANGISWAWQNGADVISNSWGHDQLASALLEDAIATALGQGRDGLGTVIVFAAGNANHNQVLYPGRVHEDTIAVGALSPCGERKSPRSCDSEWWGSNYGSELDIVAPGVGIPTTDRTGAAGYDSGDYYLHFNGTSSACPHVAAVAALMLSVNPKLTQHQVGEIIEQTARKVGSYPYAYVPKRPNGSWHQEMGYGLIDAAAAVDAALAAAEPPP